MSKFPLFIFIITLFQMSFSQVKVAELPINYESIYFTKKESLAIPNPKNNELVIFVEDYEKSYAYLLNSKMETIANLVTPSLPNSFKNFLGSNINNDGSYSIFFSNNSKKKFGVLKLDFTKKTTTNIALEFKLKKEAYVESFSHNGNFYLISVTKNSSDIHFYTFDENNNTTKNTVDFSFVNTTVNGYLKKAYHHLTTRNLGPSGALIKIDETTPNAVESTCEPNKFYILDNLFYFTFDNSKRNTTIATVDPQNFEVTHTQFEQNNITRGTNNYILNHNSYIHDNKLFQVIANTNKMNFKVTDLKSKSILKEITLNKNDSITFKNTPILQEKPGMFMTTTTRELEKTSKFLRKVSQGDIGISVYKKNDLYEIVIGSKKEVQSGNGGMMMGGALGGAMGAAIVSGVSTSFNPTFVAYGGYTSTKSVRIECLFDRSFKHINGDIPNNVFDKVKKFEDSFDNEDPVVVPFLNSLNEKNSNTKYIYEKRSDLKLKNIFRHQDEIYFAFLGSKDKNYHLIKFED